MKKFKENYGKGKATLVKTDSGPLTHLVRFEDGTLKWVSGEGYDGLELADDLEVANDAV